MFQKLTWNLNPKSAFTEKFLSPFETFIYNVCKYVKLFCLSLSQILLHEVKLFGASSSTTWFYFFSLSVWIKEQCFLLQLLTHQLYCIFIYSPSHYDLLKNSYNRVSCGFNILFSLIYYLTFEILQFINSLDITNIKHF